MTGGHGKGRTWLDTNTGSGTLRLSTPVMGKYVAAVDSGEFGQIALTTVEPGMAKYPLSYFYHPHPLALIYDNLN